MRAATAVALAALVVLVLSEAMHAASAAGVPGVHDAPGLEHGRMNKPATECRCARIFRPVCGADGRTHPNDCMAKCAGAEVLFEGECPPLQ